MYCHVIKSVRNTDSLELNMKKCTSWVHQDVTVGVRYSCHLMASIALVVELS